MPFNGSGTFSRVYSWVTDAANGILVRSDRMDTDTNDIATGLTNCVTRDGQSPPSADLPMGTHKLTGLGNGSATTDSAAFGQIATALTQAGPPSLNELRLTGTTGSAVPVSDQTAIGTLYLTPYKGSKIALYDGASYWNVRATTEISIAVPAVASTVHDVFCYDNSGVPTLEILAWTNDTTRATALVQQDGVWVKTGATTRRYIGTVRTNASNKVVDSYASRWLWNYSNRVRRALKVTEATASWAYTTATLRQANASAANQIDFVIGVAEDAVSAKVVACVSNTSASIYVTSGLGFDSTSALATGAMAVGVSTPLAAALCPTTAEAMLYPTVGRHYFAWLEYSSASGTTTWYGTNGTSVLQTGIYGEVFA